ncbi:hypothetical protein F5Y09DRAFT_347330 [Xylaria sp. FL1042]|nr:hypothetical protein F5Y09DRAFT_347330 [Xylaria sp. FL1042]
MTSSSTSLPSGTRVPIVYGIVITELVLSIAFVALRIQARRLCFGHLRLDLSDWLTISALVSPEVYQRGRGPTVSHIRGGNQVFATAYFITLAVGPVFGLGRHIETITDTRGFYIFSLVSNAFNPLAVGSLKLSILALYRSIFPSVRFHHAVTAIASLVVAWTVAALILGLTYWVPVESLWDPSVLRIHYQPENVIQLVIISVHIGVEILIFFLPVLPVLKLQASAEKKRLILITFAVGGVGCIVSIVRIPVWVLSEDVDLSCTLTSRRRNIAEAEKPMVNTCITGKIVPPALLAATELMVGFLAISFPVYRPLFKKSGHINNSNHRFAEIGDRPASRHDRSSQFQHGFTVPVGRDCSPCHLGITVTDEIELMRYPNAPP